MSRSFKFLLYYLFLSFVLGSCRDKELEEFYARPENLAAPIYQQLDSLGNFKHLLKCIDKAKYKNTLSSAGYFTLFAPNDEAFENFFQENGYSSINDIDSATAQKIVSYALVYNAFSRDRLSDYQSAAGWVSNVAYKRRTAYYVGAYKDVDNNPANLGKTILATGSNRNGATFYKHPTTKSIDNNNKHIPYFIDRYFNANNLTAFDYNYFYPNINYTGFNVAGASVVKADIFAENGYVHEVNRVTLPLPSIEEYVKTKTEYSKFWSLLQKYDRAYFLIDPDVTNRYKVLTGTSDPVYVKYYSSSLGFSPNNENFKKEEDNDAQQNGWTMFVPDNDGYENYLNNVLLEHYSSFGQLSDEIILDFINAHLCQMTVWPSQFDNSTNILGEEARFDPTVNIIEAKILSNGSFYGTNKPQEANVFHTVFGRAYLDPKYSIMTRMLKRDLKATVTNPDSKFAMFMMSDEALNKAGYYYDDKKIQWYYKGVYSTDPPVDLTRLLNLHIAYTPKSELDDLSGNGIAETFGEEYIKYSGNTVFAGGNVDSSKVINITKTLTMTNGKVYYLDGLLQFPAKSVGMKIKEMGDKSIKPYNRFYRYLLYSSLVTFTKVGIDTTDIKINGINAGSAYTFFIPTNAAIASAISAGLLPTSENTGVGSDRDLIDAFIQHHILPKSTIVPDGNKQGLYASLFKTISDEQKYLKITNNPGSLTITDDKKRVITVQLNTASNVLSNRTVIHQVDKYIDYRK